MLLTSHVLACALIMRPGELAMVPRMRTGSLAARYPLLRLCEDAPVADPPEKLHNLLLQCAIQAQLSYHNEFHNEIMSKWLEAFLGHSHLAVKRVSDRGGGVLLYRGLSDGLRCSWKVHSAPTPVLLTSRTHT